MVNQPISDTNTYTDFLPSLNLTYVPLQNLYLRFAASQAMSRPQLAVLSPSISQLTIPTAAGSLAGTMTIGNTQVEPFRATNLDLAAEWYFRPNSILSVAVFNKKLASNPQVVTFGGFLTDYLSAADIATLRAGFTDLNQLKYIDDNSPFAIRQVQNAPGGYLRGIEFNLQSDFWFLPGFLKNFGFQLNATKIKSELKYILDPGTVTAAGVVTAAPVYGKGPFLNASPEAINFTFYYQDKKFTARTSLAWRSDFYTQYPIQSGACAPGSAPGAPLTTQPCNQPLMADFIGARGGLNVDAVVTYNVNDNLLLRLEGLNLTNRPDSRFAYVANPQVTNYASSGTQLTFGARLKF